MLGAALPWLLLLGLVLHFGAHVVLVVRLALRGGASGPLAWRARGEALLAFVVSPLAPIWAWRAGMRRVTLAWCAGLGVYAVAVAIASASAS